MNESFENRYNEGVNIIIWKDNKTVYKLYTVCLAPKRFYDILRIKVDVSEGRTIMFYVILVDCCYYSYFFTVAKKC